MSSLARRTTTASLFLHVALLLLLCLWEYVALQPAKRPVGPITVRDIRIAPKASGSGQQTNVSVKHAVQKPVEHAVKETKPAAVPKPAEVTVKKSIIDNKKIPASPPKPGPPVVSENKKAMLAKAKEALNKASSGTPVASSSQAIDLPVIQALTSDGLSGVALEEVSYENKLTYALQNQLTLPERGKVSVQLTITRLGKILKVVIVSAESERNRRYIEAQLPNIIAYPFDSDMGSIAEKTFHIVLSHKL